MEILPEFALENQDSKIVTNEDLMGSWTVLFFYPRANTPG